MSVNTVGVKVRCHQRPGAKLVVTGSGFSSQEREVLKEWAQQLGFKYSGDLVCRFSTHLVCKDLMAAFNGPKYVKALHWGITIVSFRWLYDSLQAGRLLPTGCYKSDTPSPADNAMRAAVALRMRLAALQEASRAPLRELSTNSQTRKSFDGKAVDLPGRTNSRMKRRAGCEQDVAVHDFTFDVPSGCALDISPRFCQVVSTAQQLEPSNQNNCRLLMAEDIEPKAMAEELADQTGLAPDSALGPTGQLLSPPTCKQPLGPTPSTVDVSFSELHEEMVITAAAAENVPQVEAESPDGDSQTPASAHRPAADDAGAISGSIHGEGELEAALFGQEQPTVLRLPSDSNMLYSGFEVPLAAIATASKGRRLVRTDRMSMAIRSDTTGCTSGDEPPSYGCLEDDLEDDLDHEPPRATAKSTQPSASGKLVVDSKRAALPFVSAPLPRPSLPSSTSHVKNLPASVSESKSIKGHRFLKPMTAMATGTSRVSERCTSSERPQEGASELEVPSLRIKGEPGTELEQMGPVGPVIPRVPDGAEFAVRPYKRLQQKHHQRALCQQQGGQALEQEAPEPTFANEALVKNEQMRIKGEPGSGPVGPIMLQVPNATELATAVGRGASAKQPSERRRAAALAISSLMSEPEPMAPWPLGKKLAREPGQGALRTRIDSKGAVDDDDDDGTSCSRGTSSGLSDLDVSPPSSPSSNSRSRPQKATPSRQGWAQGEFTSSDEDTTRVRERGSARAGRASAVASQKGVMRIASRRKSASEDEECSMDMPSGANRPRANGYGPVRNATAVKTLPRVEGSKAGPMEGTMTGNGSGDHNDTSTTQSVADTLDAGVGADDRDGDSDYDGLAQPKARPSLSSSQSHSQSQSGSQHLEVSPHLNHLPRAPFTDDKSTSEYLRTSAIMAEEYLAKEWPSTAGELLSDGHIRVVKAMGRPKAHTVLQYHPRVALKMVQFAEQVMVEPLNLLVNCRDKTKRARCVLIALMNGGDAPEGSLGREIFLAEPCNIYRLPSGEWWLEYNRYFSESDVTALCATAGRPLNLPSDFDSRREFMRDAETSHCRMIHLRGDMVITRTKKANPQPERGRAAASGRPMFCRYIFDKNTCAPIMVQQAADYIID